VWMWQEILEEPLLFPVPGIHELPLSVEISAIEETPAIEAIHARVGKSDDQFTPGQDRLRTTRSRLIGHPTVRHGSEFGKEDRLAFAVAQCCPGGGIFHLLGD